MGDPFLKIHVLIIPDDLASRWGAAVLSLNDPFLLSLGSPCQNFSHGIVHNFIATRPARSGCPKIIGGLLQLLYQTALMDP